MSKNKPKPVVSIVIPVLNQAEKTIMCLRSIRANTKLPHEIIWVDNGSKTSEYSMIRRQATRPRVQCKLVKNGYNLGFVKATNQGIHEAVGEYVILLNNDTEVSWKWATRLIKPLMHNPKIGAVGPVTQSTLSWQSPAHLNMRFDLSMPRYTNNPPEYAQMLINKYDGEYLDAEKTNLSFFCAAFRRSMFKEVGLLNEEISIGLGDDDEYCLRMRAAKYKLLVSLGTFVYHHHRTTFNDLRLGLDSLRRHNLKILKKTAKRLEAEDA